MKVMDIFSWLPAQEISLEQLERIFVNYKNGVSDDVYTVCFEILENVPKNILDCRDGLIAEGKKVVGILQDNNIIGIIGYRE